MTARGRFGARLVTMLIALAGFVTVGAPTAAASSTSTLQYVALGDSYAAGVGAGSYDGTDCMRSSKGYPALLDPKGRIDLQVNATCAGATISTVLSLVTSKESPLNPDTDLVTLTVGGNDLGFAGLAGNCLPAPNSPECQQAIAAAFDLLPKKCGDNSPLGELLTQLYAAIAAEAENALIVVTGYPLLFELVPEDPQLATKTQINAATTLLNCAIEKAVAVTDAQTDGVNIVYVDVTEAFEGHGIGALDDPYINGPTATDGPFHPNAAGYRAYARAIFAAIRSVWLDDKKHVA